jgi:hypothetical protein
LVFHISFLPIVIGPTPTIYMEDDLVIIDSGPSMSVVSSLPDTPQFTPGTTATPNSRKSSRNTFIGAHEVNPAVSDFCHRVPSPTKWCGPKVEQDDRHPHGTKAEMRRHQRQQGILDFEAKGNMGPTGNFPNLELPYRKMDDVPLPPINHSSACRFLRPLSFPEQTFPTPPPPVSFGYKS